MSDDSDVIDDPYLASSGASTKGATSSLSAFFQAFRSHKNGDKYPDSRDAGMEQNLLNKIERMNFKDQMEMFYTAYSKASPPPPSTSKSFSL